MRRVSTYTVSEANRDKGKVFRLTEMSAVQAEEWAIKAFLAMGRAGVEMPDNIEEAGFAGIALMGIGAISRLNYADAKPLLDEMMDCIEILPDPNNRNVVRALIESDIEEVKTRLKLRKEVLDLHLGFSMGVAPSNATTSK